MLNLRRVCSLILVVSIFVTQCALAHAVETNFWAERRRSEAVIPSEIVIPAKAGIQSLNFSLKKVYGLDSRFRGNDESHLSFPLQPLLNSIPLTHATVQDIHSSGDPKSPIVALIQDVHMNTEAQTNIAAVLQALINQNQVGLVGVEGAFQTLDFAPFRSFPDQKVAKVVTESFFKKNILAAPSFVGITSPVDPPPFVGVDDKRHYNANVQAYLDSRPLQKKVAEKIEKQKRHLAEQKAAVFSKELKEFDALRTSYQSSSLEFGRYVRGLVQSGSRTDTVIQHFLSAYEMEESLNFSQVEQERKILLEKLTRQLTPEETSNLMAQSLAYRLGSVSFGTYYQELKKLCEKKGLSLRQTPAFDNYIRYVLLSDGIKADQLFEAVSDLEQEILNEVATTPEEKRLMEESEYLNLAGKLIHFELTPKEWGRYKVVIPAKAGIQASNHSLKKVYDLDSRFRGNDDLKPFESFYEEADLRSRKMVENIFKPIINPQAPNPNKSIESLKFDDWKLSHATVLVTGGFHTPLITQLLRQQNVSYIVVSPKISKIEDGASGLPAGAGSAYLSVFAREKTPLDRLFEGEKLFLKPRGGEIGSATGAKMMGSMKSRSGEFASLSIAHVKFIYQKIFLDLIVRKSADPANDEYQLKQELWVAVREFAYQIPICLIALSAWLSSSPSLLALGWAINFFIAWRFAKDHGMSKWKTRLLFVLGFVMGVMPLLGVHQSYVWASPVAAMAIHLVYNHFVWAMRWLARQSFIATNFPWFVRFAQWLPLATITEKRLQRQIEFGLDPSIDLEYEVLQAVRSLRSAWWQDRLRAAQVLEDAARRLSREGNNDLSRALLHALWAQTEILERMSYHHQDAVVRKAAEYALQEIYHLFSQPHIEGKLGHPIDHESPDSTMQRNVYASGQGHGFSSADEITKFNRLFPHADGHVHFGSSVPQDRVWELALERTELDWAPLDQALSLLYSTNVDLTSLLAEARRVILDDELTDDEKQLRLKTLRNQFDRFTQLQPSDPVDLKWFVLVYGVRALITRGEAALQKDLAQCIARGRYDKGVRLLIQRVSLPRGEDEPTLYQRILERAMTIKEGFEVVEREINEKLGEDEVGLETRLVFTAEKMSGQQDILMQTRVLLKVLEEHDVLKRYVVGFDVAGDESLMSPSQFVDIFGLIQDYNIRRLFTHDPLLSLTYHSGEDFRHVSMESSIRHIDELVEMGVDSIGHGLVLGVDPGRFLGREKQETISERVAQIYYDLRNHKFDQEGVTSVGLVLDERSLWEELDRYASQNRDIAQKVVPTIKRILGSSHLDERLQKDLYRSLNRLTERHPQSFIKVIIDSEEKAEELRKRQRYILNKVIERRVVIEFNPTINVLIGPMKNYGEHPIVRLLSYRYSGTKPRLEHARVIVTINTDNPAFLGIDQHHEYVQITQAFQLTREDVGKLIENGIRYRLGRFPLLFHSQIRAIFYSNATGERRQPADSLPLSVNNSLAAFLFVSASALGLHFSRGFFHMSDTLALEVGQLVWVLPIFFLGVFLLPASLVVANWALGSPDATGPPAIRLWGRTAVPTPPGTVVDFIQYNQRTNRFEVNPILYSLLTHPFFLVRFLTHLVLNVLLVPVHEGWHAFASRYEWMRQWNLHKERGAFGAQAIAFMAASVMIYFFPGWAVGMLACLVVGLSLYWAKAGHLRISTEREDLTLEVILKLPTRKYLFPSPLGEGTGVGSPAFSETRLHQLKGSRPPSWPPPVGGRNKTLGYGRKVLGQTLGRFLKFTDESLSDPNTDKRAILYPFFLRNFFKPSNFGFWKFHGHHSHLGFGKLDRSRLKFTQVLCRIFFIPELGFFFIRMKLGYFGFPHLLSPLVKPSFGSGHVSSRDDTHSTPVLSGQFKKQHGNKLDSAIFGIVWLLQEVSKIFNRNLGTPQDRSERTGLYRFGTMHRNNSPPIQINLMAHDGMATGLSEQNETRFLKGADSTGTRNLGQVRHQAAMSLMKMWRFWRAFWSSLIDHKYSFMAFLMFLVASWIVSPWVAQPGSSGTYTEYPPLFSVSIMTLYFIGVYLAYFLLIRGKSSTESNIPSLVSQDDLLGKPSLVLKVAVLVLVAPSLLWAAAPFPTNPQPFGSLAESLLLVGIVIGVMILKTRWQRGRWPFNSPQKFSSRLTRLLPLSSSTIDRWYLRYQRKFKMSWKPELIQNPSSFPQTPRELLKFVFDFFTEIIDWLINTHTFFSFSFLFRWILQGTRLAIVYFPLGRPKEVDIDNLAKKLDRQLETIRSLEERMKAVQRFFRFRRGGFRWFELMKQRFEALDESHLSTTDFIGPREYSVHLMGAYLEGVLKSQGRLVKQKTDDIFYFLKQQLRDSDPGVVKACVRAIGKVVPALDNLKGIKNDIATHYLTILNDPSKPIMARDAVARGLREILDPRDINPIADTLERLAIEEQHNDSLAWTQAYLAEALEFLIKDSKLDLRRHDTAQRLVPFLIKKAKDREHSNIALRINCVKALGRLRGLDQTHLTHLLNIFEQDPDPTIQWAALWALARLYASPHTQDPDLNIFFRSLTRFIEWRIEEPGTRRDPILLEFVTKVARRFGHRRVDPHPHSKPSPPNPLLFVDVTHLLGRNPGNLLSLASQEVSHLLRHLHQAGFSVIVTEAYREGRDTGNLILIDGGYRVDTHLRYDMLQNGLDQLSRTHPILSLSRDPHRGKPPKRMDRVVAPVPGKPIVVLCRQHEHQLYSHYRGDPNIPLISLDSYPAILQKPSELSADYGRLIEDIFSSNTNSDPSPVNHSSRKAGGGGLSHSLLGSLLGPVMEAYLNLYFSKRHRRLVDEYNSSPMVDFDRDHQRAEKEEAISKSVRRTKAVVVVLTLLFMLALDPLWETLFFFDYPFHMIRQIIIAPNPNNVIMIQFIIWIAILFPAAHYLMIRHHHYLLIRYNKIAKLDPGAWFKVGNQIAQLENSSQINFWLIISTKIILGILSMTPYFLQLPYAYWWSAGIHALWNLVVIILAKVGWINQFWLYTGSLVGGLLSGVSVRASLTEDEFDHAIQVGYALKYAATSEFAGQNTLAILNQHPDIFSVLCGFSNGRVLQNGSDEEFLKLKNLLFAVNVSIGSSFDVLLLGSGQALVINRETLRHVAMQANAYDREVLLFDAGMDFLLLKELTWKRGHFYDELTKESKNTQLRVEAQQVVKKIISGESIKRQTSNPIQDIVFPSVRSADLLYKSMCSYMDAMQIFGHQFPVFWVFDDATGQIAEDKKAMLAKLAKDRRVQIQYVGEEEKRQFIRMLAKSSAAQKSSFTEEKLQNEFFEKGKFGSNRNFVQLYMSGRIYSTVDDDSYSIQTVPAKLSESLGFKHDDMAILDGMVAMLKSPASLFGHEDTPLMQAINEDMNRDMQVRLSERLFQFFSLLKLRNASSTTVENFEKEVAITLKRLIVEHETVGAKRRTFVNNAEGFIGGEPIQIFVDAYGVHGGYVGKISDPLSVYKVAEMEAAKVFLDNRSLGHGKIGFVITAVNLDGAGSLSNDVDDFTTTLDDGSFDHGGRHILAKFLRLGVISGAYRLGTTTMTTMDNRVARGLVVPGFIDSHPLGAAIQRGDRSIHAYNPRICLDHIRQPSPVRYGESTSGPNYLKIARDLIEEKALIDAAEAYSGFHTFEDRVLDFTHDLFGVADDLRKRLEELKGFDQKTIDKKTRAADFLRAMKNAMEGLEFPTLIQATERVEVKIQRLNQQIAKDKKRGRKSGNHSLKKLYPYGVPKVIEFKKGGKISRGMMSIDLVKEALSDGDLRRFVEGKIQGYFDQYKRINDIGDELHQEAIALRGNGELPFSKFSEDKSSDLNSSSLLTRWVGEALRRKGVDPESFKGRIILGPAMESGWYLLLGHGVGVVVGAGLSAMQMYFGLGGEFIRYGLLAFYSAWVLLWSGLKFAMDHDREGWRSFLQKFGAGLFMGVAAFGPLIIGLIYAPPNLPIVRHGEESFFFDLFVALSPVLLLGLILAHLFHMGVNFQTLPAHAKRQALGWLFDLKHLGPVIYDRSNMPEKTDPNKAHRIPQFWNVMANTPAVPDDQTTHVNGWDINQRHSNRPIAGGDQRRAGFIQVEPELNRQVPSNGRESSTRVQNKTFRNSGTGGSLERHGWDEDGVGGGGKGYLEHRSVPQPFGRRGPAYTIWIWNGLGIAIIFSWITSLLVLWQTTLPVFRLLPLYLSNMNWFLYFLLASVSFMFLVSSYLYVGGELPTTSRKSNIPTQGGQAGGWAEIIARFHPLLAHLFGSLIVQNSLMCIGSNSGGLLLHMLSESGGGQGKSPDQPGSSSSLPPPHKRRELLLDFFKEHANRWFGLYEIVENLPSLYGYGQTQIILDDISELLSQGHRELIRKNIHTKAFFGFFENLELADSTLPETLTVYNRRRDHIVETLRKLSVDNPGATWTSTDLYSRLNHSLRGSAFSYGICLRELVKSGVVERICVSNRFFEYRIKKDAPLAQGGNTTPLLTRWAKRWMERREINPDSFFGRVMVGPAMESAWYLLLGHAIGFVMGAGLSAAQMYFGLGGEFTRYGLIVFYSLWVLLWSGLKFAMDHEEKGVTLLAGLIMGVAAFGPLIIGLIYTPPGPPTVLRGGEFLFGLLLAHLFHMWVNFQTLPARVRRQFLQKIQFSSPIGEGAGVGFPAFSETRLHQLKGSRPPSWLTAASRLWRPPPVGGRNKTLGQSISGGHGKSPNQWFSLKDIATDPAAVGYLFFNLFPLTPIWQLVAAVAGLLGVYYLEAPMVLWVVRNATPLGWATFIVGFVGVHFLLKIFSKNPAIRGSPWLLSIIRNIAVIYAYRALDSLGLAEVGVWAHMVMDISRIADHHPFSLLRSQQPSLLTIENHRPSRVVTGLIYLFVLANYGGPWILKSIPHLHQVPYVHYYILGLVALVAAWPFLWQAVESHRNAKVMRLQHKIQSFFVTALRRYGRRGPEFIPHKPSTLVSLMHMLRHPALMWLEMLLYHLFAFEVMKVLNSLGRGVLWMWLHIIDQSPQEIAQQQLLVDNTRTALRESKTRETRRRLMRWRFRFRRGGYVWAESAMAEYQKDLSRSAQDVSQDNYMGLRERLIEPLGDFLTSMVTLRGHLNSPEDKEILHCLVKAIDDPDPYVVKVAVRGIGQLAKYLPHSSREMLCAKFVQVLHSHQHEIAVSAASRGLKKILVPGSVHRIISAIQGDASTSSHLSNYWIEAYLLEAFEALLDSEGMEMARELGFEERWIQQLLPLTQSHEDLSVRVNSLMALTHFSDSDGTIRRSIILLLQTDPDPTLQQVGLWALTQLTLSESSAKNVEELASFLLLYIKGDHPTINRDHFRPNPVSKKLAKKLLRLCSRFIVDDQLKKRISQALEAESFWKKIRGGEFWRKKVVYGREIFSDLFGLNHTPGTNRVVFVDVESNLASPFTEEAFSALQKRLFEEGHTALFTRDYYQKRSLAEFVGTNPEDKGKLWIRFQTGYLAAVINRLSHHRPARIQRRDRTRGDDVDRFAYVAIPVRAKPIVVFGKKEEAEALANALGWELPVVPMSKFVRAEITPEDPGPIKANSLVIRIEQESTAPIVLKTREDWLGKTAKTIRELLDLFLGGRKPTYKSRGPSSLKTTNIGAIAGPELSREELDDWVEDIEKNSRRVYESNRDVVERVGSRSRQLFETHGGRLRELLKHKGVSDTDIESVIKILNNADLYFQWFEGRVEGRERYLLGTSQALSVDLIFHLEEEEIKGNHKQLIAEYILHEALESLENLSHNDIIALTTDLFGHPSSEKNGRTPLGQAIRLFIDGECARAELKKFREVVEHLVSSTQSIEWMKIRDIRPAIEIINVDLPRNFDALNARQAVELVETWAVRFENTVVYRLLPNMDAVRLNGRLILAAASTRESDILHSRKTAHWPRTPKNQPALPLSLINKLLAATPEQRGKNLWVALQLYRSSSGAEAEEVKAYESLWFSLANKKFMVDQKFAGDIVGYWEEFTDQTPLPKDLSGARKFLRNSGDQSGHRLAMFEVLMEGVARNFVKKNREPLEFPVELKVFRFLTSLLFLETFHHSTLKDLDSYHRYIRREVKTLHSSEDNQPFQKFLSSRSPKLIGFPLMEVDDHWPVNRRKLGVISKVLSLTGEITISWIEFDDSSWNISLYEKTYSSWEFSNQQENFHFPRFNYKETPLMGGDGGGDWGEDPPDEGELLSSHSGEHYIWDAFSEGIFLFPVTILLIIVAGFALGFGWRAPPQVVTSVLQLGPLLDLLTRSTRVFLFKQVHGEAAYLANKEVYETNLPLTPTLSPKGRGRMFTHPIFYTLLARQFLRFDRLAEKTSWVEFFVGAVLFKVGAYYFGWGAYEAVVLATAALLIRWLITSLDHALQNHKFFKYGPSQNVFVGASHSGIGSDDAAQLVKDHEGRLSELKPTYASVLRGRYLEGKTLQQIADEEKVHNSAIFFREQRALKALRVLIQSSSPSPIKLVRDHEGRLSELKPTYASVLRKRYLEGKTLQQIADEEGHTKQAIFGLAQFALKALRALIQSPELKLVKDHESRLSELKPAHESVLRKRYLEGKTLQQIADEEGHTKQAIFSLAQFALKALRVLIQSYSPSRIKLVRDHEGLLSKLKPTYASVLRKRYLEWKTLRQIADEEGHAHTAIFFRERRALKALQALVIHKSSEPEHIGATHSGQHYIWDAFSEGIFLFPVTILLIIVTGFALGFGWRAPPELVIAFLQLGSLLDLLTRPLRVFLFKQVHGDAAYLMNEEVYEKHKFNFTRPLFYTLLARQFLRFDQLSEKLLWVELAVGAVLFKAGAYYFGWEVYEALMMATAALLIRWLITSIYHALKNHSFMKHGPSKTALVAASHSGTFMSVWEILHPQKPKNFAIEKKKLTRGAAARYNIDWKFWNSMCQGYGLEVHYIDGQPAYAIAVPPERSKLPSQPLLWFEWVQLTAKREGFYPVPLLEANRTKNGGILKLTRNPKISSQFLLENTALIVPVLFQRRGVVEIDYGVVNSQQLSLRVLDQWDAPSNERKQRSHLLPRDYVGQHLMIRLFNGVVTDFILGEPGGHQEWVPIYREPSDREIVHIPGKRRPGVPKQYKPWKPRPLDDPLGDVDPSPFSVLLADPGSSPLAEIIRADDIEWVKDRLGEDFDILMDLLSSIELMDRRKLETFLTGVSHKLTDGDEEKAQAIRRRLLENFEDDHQAMDQGARWLAQMVVALSNQDASQVIVGSLENEPIHVSGIAGLVGNRPDMTLVDLEEWSRDPVFIAAFLKEIGKGKVELSENEAQLVMGLLAVAGVSPEIIALLTKLVTKRQSVVVFDRSVTREQLKAGLVMTSLLKQKLTIAVPEGLQLKLDKMLALIRKKSTESLPHIDFIAEGSSALFRRNKNRLILNAGVLEQKLQGVSLSDVALLHSDSLEISSGSKNLLLIRLEDLEPLAKLDWNLIPVIVRRFLQAA